MLRLQNQKPAWKQNKTNHFWTRIELWVHKESKQQQQTEYNLRQKLLKKELEKNVK